MHNSISLRFLKAGFTLIELLVVIGIVAVISVVVLLTLNPAELLRQARDSNRLAELATIHKSLGVVGADILQPYLGEPTVVYVSLPDPTLSGGPNQATSTCPNMGLPPSAPGWTYQCAAPSLYHNVNGTGWIPVDFTTISSGAPFSALPVDPKNTAVSGLYYAYVSGGSWAVTATLESQKYLKVNALGDGGTDDGRVEKGSDLSLWARAMGLLGRWKFEGDFSDTSGKGNSGTANGGVTFASGKVGQGANLDGSTGYVVSANSLDLDGKDFTFLAWIKGTVGGGDRAIFGHGTTQASCQNLAFTARTIGPNIFPHFGLYGAGCDMDSTTPLAGNVWYHLAFVNAQSGAVTEKIYLNGALDRTGTLSSYGGTDTPLYVGRWSSTASGYFGGIIDEAIVYERALSAAEIRAIYEATK